MNGLIMNWELKSLKLNSVTQMMCYCMEMRNSWKWGGSFI